MGLFKKAVNVMRSNINSMLDGLEDPAKIAEMTLTDAKEKYLKLRNESSKVVANAIQMEKKYKNAVAEADKWHEIAKKALLSGNESDAKAALENENKAREKANELEEIYKVSKADSENTQNALQLLAKRINELEGKKDVVQAKATTAKIKQKAAELDFGKADGALDVFKRMEEKADKELAKAEAMEQMNTAEHAEIDSANDLMKKYSCGSEATNAALEDLKKELGL